MIFDFLPVAWSMESRRVKVGYSDNHTRVLSVVTQVNSRGLVITFVNGRSIKGRCVAS